MLRSSPRDQREEREDEVQRLERAVKRAESSVNRDEREHVEREALEKALKEEKDKRKAGKGEWHLKKCKFCIVIRYVNLFSCLLPSRKERTTHTSSPRRTR